MTVMIIIKQHFYNVFSLWFKIALQIKVVIYNIIIKEFGAVFLKLALRYIMEFSELTNIIGNLWEE